MTMEHEDIADMTDDIAGVVRALKSLPEAPRRDIAGRVMELVREEDRRELDAVQETLRGLPPFEGKDIAPDVMARIRRDERRRKMAVRFGRVAAAACAVALLGVGIARWHSGADAPPVVADVDISTPEAGAAWLLAAQLPEGGWDTTAFGGRPEHKPALTALGLLALHRQDPAGNREAVRRGAEALCAQQHADGSFGRGGALRINQGLVTAVLLEINQSLHSERLGESLAAALSFSRRAMAMGDGSWGYSCEPGPRNGALFASEAPARRGPELHEALEDGLHALPRLSPGADENRFYQSCLAVLAAR